MATVFRAAAALLMSLVFVAQARAEPIPIMGGTLSSGTNFPDFRATFALTVPGGAVEGNWPGGALQVSGACFACSAGTAVTPGAGWLSPEVPSDIQALPFPTGSVFVNGVGGSGPLSGQLLFFGDPFALPDLGDVDQRMVTFGQPFTFRGSITVYERLQTGPFDPAQLISVDLVGLGTAHMEFARIDLGNGRSEYLFRQTTYEFEPVPEPLSMLTVATGLGVLLRRRLRGVRS